jgi:hypothetical protein
VAGNLADIESPTLAEQENERVLAQFR